MIVGVTGHQKREGVNWQWVSQSIVFQLTQIQPVRVMTSLAEGTDQIFAEAALELGIRVEAIIPLDRYERFFSSPAAENYSRLVKLSDVTSLHWQGDPEHAFLNAGRYIVDHCDAVFAVWDGEAADGVGGTADIVGYAVERGRLVLHLNPCDETVNQL